MKNYKILIVVADYYKDIAKGLLNSANKKLSKKFLVKVTTVHSCNFY
jgi:6,7-dimethyl-8-ribityllumazine synthase